jgi:urease accessory protein
MGLVGFFAMFHGHAHGVETPQTASGLEYGAGFVVATATLHAIGVGLGLAVGRLSAAYGRRVLQTAGAATAVTGVAILAGYV